MKNYRKLYRDLETSVMFELRKKIENSKYTSSFVNEKAIKVDVSDYVELVIINDRLTFLDGRGYQYTLWDDVIFEDLIDILEVK